jgi:hypothetical protein
MTAVARSKRENDPDGAAVEILIALVRADEAGSVGDETEMVDLGGIAAAAVAERVPAAFAAGVDIQFARRKASLPFLALSTRPHSIAVCVGN